eukprot:1142777-Pelagomonas_calceolata.AAC.3
MMFQILLLDLGGRSSRFPASSFAPFRPEQSKTPTLLEVKHLSTDRESKVKLGENCATVCSMEIYPTAVAVAAKQHQEGGWSSSRLWTAQGDENGWVICKIGRSSTRFDA